MRHLAILAALAGCGDAPEDSGLDTADMGQAYAVSHYWVDCENTEVNFVTIDPAGLDDLLILDCSGSSACRLPSERSPFDINDNHDGMVTVSCAGTHPGLAWVRTIEAHGGADDERDRLYPHAVEVECEGDSPPRWRLEADDLELWPIDDVAVEVVECVSDTCAAPPTLTVEVDAERGLEWLYGDCPEDLVPPEITVFKPVH